MLWKWRVLNFDRILGQNFPRMPFSLYPALIVLDLCDVNRIFKRAPISRRPLSPFAFGFTSRKTARPFLVKGHHFNCAMKNLWDNFYSFCSFHERTQKLKCLIKNKGTRDPKSLSNSPLVQSKLQNLGQHQWSDLDLIRNRRTIGWKRLRRDR